MLLSIAAAAVAQNNSIISIVNRHRGEENEEENRNVKLVRVTMLLFIFPLQAGIRTQLLLLSKLLESLEKLSEHLMVCFCAWRVLKSFNRFAK